MRQIIAFFSTDGRTGVIRFAVILVIACAIFYACLVALNSFSTVLFPVIGAIAGATLAKLVAEGGRRLHDVGHGGAIGLIAGVMVFPIAVILLMEIATGSAAIILGVVGTLLPAAIFLRPGARVANRFGDRAAGWLHTGSPVRLSSARGVVLCACLAVAGGAAIGFTFKAISDSTLEERERRTRLQLGQAYPAGSKSDWRIKLHRLGDVASCFCGGCAFPGIG